MTWTDQIMAGWADQDVTTHGGMMGHDKAGHSRTGYDAQDVVRFERPRRYIPELDGTEQDKTGWDGTGKERDRTGHVGLGCDGKNGMERVERDMVG